MYSKRGISLLSLIIIIVVIIILASVAIFAGISATDKAQFAKFVSNFSGFRDAIMQEFNTKREKYTISQITRSDSQIYYMIATGKGPYDFLMTDIPVSEGTVSQIESKTGKLYPDTISGKEIYLIQDEELYNKKTFFSKDETHYLTDAGTPFILPGYRVVDGKQEKWYINDNTYYIGNPVYKLESLPITFTVTYMANGGYFGNSINTTSNKVTYSNGSITNGKYYIPKYETKSFRGWYTSSTLEDGTEFDVNQYTGSSDITVYAKSSADRAIFNARDLYRRLHDGAINGKRIKNAIVMVKRAKEFPEWATGKKVTNNLGETDEYKWLVGWENGLPMMFWLDKDSLTLYWYSEDPCPIITYTEQYGTICGFSEFSSLEDFSGAENWDFSQMDMLDKFFYGCSKLKDLTPAMNWNVSNVKSMEKTFSYMTSLEDASAINNWDISQVTNFTRIFEKTNTKPTFTKKIGTFDKNGTFVVTE